jgi:hypothetical protein
MDCIILCYFIIYSIILKYQPGGPGYLEGMERFQKNSLKILTLGINE